MTVSLWVTSPLVSCAGRALAAWNSPPTISMDLPHDQTVRNNEKARMLYPNILFPSHLFFMNIIFFAKGFW